ncbi:hypothetical protein Pmani_031040 [Petrolisthes manimaculis]|uniref:BTB domain-containing protein n=1 Tax=Petrolisthes manimaculis TaxID=1843537 RepID=A0AAE1NVW7_9EUCA|nr:hypothetical protein Pmani_031040 [Petrolisthes manimaculis]
MSIREGKAGRRNDSVWSHFTKRWTDEKHYVVICIHCKQRVSAKVDRLRRHLRKCVPRLHYPKPEVEGMEESLLAGMSCSNPQPIATETSNVDTPSSQLSPPWNQENALVDSKDSPHSPSAMANQQYCLKWNNHQSNLLRAFDRLLQSESFTDVTLACEGKSLRAHKVVLSACSSYFEQLFEEHPDKSPIIILKDMKFIHVSQLVNFMYRGEINITQDMLSGLLKTAETLKVKGLAEVSGDSQHTAQVANPIPPILRLGAVSIPVGSAAHVPHTTQELLQHATRPVTLPQMVVPNTSPLTTALNAPLVTPPTLAPLAALLNPESLSSLDERRVNFLKRMKQEHEASINNNNSSSGGGGPGGGLHEPPSKMARHEQRGSEKEEDSSGSVPLPHHAIFMTPPEKLQQQAATSSSSPMQNVLTPIPHELTVNARQELPDFLKCYNIFKLNDYLGFRTRQQFWEEPSVRRILEGIKNKEIDMKSAAELLGVSYGTLYGRYREVFGYLKHSWVNKQGRVSGGNGGGSSQKERSIWDESRAQDLIQRVLNKELSLTAAAVRLGVDTNTFFSHLTDNGKNKSRVALLLGTDLSGSPSSDSSLNNNNATSASATNHHQHNDDSNSANASLIDATGEDSNPPGGNNQASDDSNMDGLMDASRGVSKDDEPLNLDTSHQVIEDIEGTGQEPELNGEKEDNEDDLEVIDDAHETRTSEQALGVQDMHETRSSEQAMGVQDLEAVEEAEDQLTEDQEHMPQQTMESFQSIVEDDSANMYAEAS